MSSIPLADAPGFAPQARRTLLVRSALIALAAAAVVAVSLLARAPHSRTIVSLPSHADAIVVLDLSASIGSDTFSRIGAHARLARSQSRPVSGSSSSPPGRTRRCRRARPPKTSRRSFAISCRSRQGAGFAQTYPRIPGRTCSAPGTRISSGLELAHQVAVGTGVRRPVVILVSDLDDDPTDLPRLASIVLAYRRDRIPLRIVGLNPSSQNAAFFQRLRRAGDPDRRGGRRDARAAAPEPHAVPVDARRARRRRGARDRGARALGGAARVGAGAMRALRLVAVLALVVLGALAALLAADVRLWQRTLAAGDVAARPRLPWNVARTTALAVGDDDSSCGARSQLFTRDSVDARTTRQRPRRDCRPREGGDRARGRSRAVRAARASQAATLLGVLAFGDLARGGGRNASQAQTALGDFTDAVRADPSNEIAKFDLELLMRALVARGVSHRDDRGRRDRSNRPKRRRQRRPGAGLLIASA